MLGLSMDAATRVCIMSTALNHGLCGRVDVARNMWGLFQTIDDSWVF